MTKKPQPQPEPQAQPLPSGGGSYNIDASGDLVQVEAPTREEGEKAPAKPDVKEG